MTILEECYVYLGFKHTFQQVGCVKRQRVVSQNSVGAEIMSLDTGLRAARSDKWRANGSAAKARSTKFSRNEPSINGIGFVPQHFEVNALSPHLCVFEGNEAVIKMILQGRSSSLRHATLTHRVDVVSLLEQIKHSVSTRRIRL